MLSPTEKLILLEHFALTMDGRGAYISAVGMGARLDLGSATIERARERFKNWGLLARGGGNNGQTATWLPVFPTEHPGGVKISPDTVESCRKLLDAHITRRNGGDADDLNAGEDSTSPSPHDGGLSTK